MIAIRCTDDHQSIRNSKFCLYELSKNAKGVIEIFEQDREECRQDCTTLRTRHGLKLETSSHDPCDSSKGRLLGGTLHSPNLTHAFKDGDANGRGVHGGTFRWENGVVGAEGTLSGITNAGTHRDPLFKECQPCDANGYMEGRFCGRIIYDQEGVLTGCQIIGTYRFFVKGGFDEGQTSIFGTLEGMIVCPCREKPPQKICIDLRGYPLGLGQNPIVDQGVTFTVRNSQGVKMPNSWVPDWPAPTGLHVFHTMEVDLPVPASSVDATLVHYALPATLEGFDTEGTSVGQVAMGAGQGQEETLQIQGQAIQRVVITAPLYDTLLLELCYQPM